MEISMTEQGIVFLFSCFVGVFLGVFYDIFRICRIAFRPQWIAVFIQDIVFCVISSFIIILSIYYTNSGQVRLFGLAGCFLCFVLYHLTIGRFVIFVSAKIIDFIKQVLGFVYNITVRPVIIVFLFIFSLIKKQTKFMLEILNNIKAYAGYIYERGTISREAGKGFGLYKKSKIPKENMKIINKNNKEIKQKFKSGGSNGGKIKETHKSKNSGKVKTAKP